VLGEGLALVLSDQEEVPQVCGPYQSFDGRELLLLFVGEDLGDFPDFTPGELISLKFVANTTRVRKITMDQVLSLVAFRKNVLLGRHTTPPFICNNDIVN